MDILRRSHAPLGDAAWRELEQQATSILTSNLSNRVFVDVEGPHGLQYAAVNLGRIDPDRTGQYHGVQYGVRQVLPLCECRSPFVMSLTELENLERGADQIELGPLVEACLASARFEEHAVFHGFGAGGIKGLVEASEHPSIELGSEPDAFPDRVTAAMIRLHDAGVSGPYRLVLGPHAYRTMAGDVSGYPVRQQLSKLLDSDPIYSPALQGGGVLVSARGGDFILTLGHDLTIGFDHWKGDEVHLYVFESFTFRPVGGEACVALAG